MVAGLSLRDARGSASNNAEHFSRGEALVRELMQSPDTRVIANFSYDHLAPSPEMTLRTLSQYNSTTNEISTSVRFNWIYSPGSDIYVVYDELRMDTNQFMFDPHVRQSPWLSNRQLAIKMTYLWSR